MGFVIRVFVAVDLSGEARVELGRLIEKLSAKRWQVKWEKPEKLHYTLFFVGWTEEDKVSRIIEAVKEGIKGISPFSTRLGYLGVFPDYVQPRVVWLGIKGDQQELVKLRRQIAKALVERGFSDEKRGWVPHLTIGRIKNEARFRAKKELGRQLGKLDVGKFLENSLIDRVVVYQSILNREGSEYKKLSEIPL